MTPDLKAIAAVVRRQRPYGKVVAAYLTEGTVAAAQKAGGGLNAAEAIRQIRLGLPGFLVAYNQSMNVG